MYLGAVKLIQSEFARLGEYIKLLGEKRGPVDMGPVRKVKESW
jgi:hypothetical protein